MISTPAICNYCGDLATTRDHVIPISVLTSGARPKGSGAKAWGETVPACGECNGLLGSSLLASMEDRAAYVATRLQARYGKLLAMPAWDDGELADLGPGMRRHLLDCIARVARIKARIAFAKYAATGR